MKITEEPSRQADIHARIKVGPGDAGSETLHS